MSAENPKFWGLEGDEELHHTDISGRLREYAKGWGSIDAFPESVVMVGMDPMPIEDKFAEESVLENLLERWEEYASPYDETEITDEMKAATHEYVEKIKSLYRVWSCHEVTRKTVNVRDYLNEDEIPISLTPERHELETPE